MPRARAAARAAGLAEAQAAEAKSPIICSELEGLGHCLGPFLCARGADAKANRRIQTSNPLHISGSGLHSSNKEVLMKSAFPILAAAAVLLGASSAEAARPMGGNSNIIIARPPPLQSSLPPQANSGALNMPQPLGTPPVNTGTIGITSPSAWRSRPAKLRRAAGQSGIRDLRSERSPAQFRQLWVGDCPRPGVVSHRCQHPEHQRQRRDVTAGSLPCWQTLEPIASCLLG